MPRFSGSYFRAVIAWREPGCTRSRRLRLGEKRAVVAVPVAGKNVAGIVMVLEPEKLAKLRVAGLDLRTRGPAMVGEIKAAAMSDAEIDQAAKDLLGGGEPRRRMRDAEIKNDAGQGSRAQARKLSVSRSTRRIVP